MNFVFVSSKTLLHKKAKAQVVEIQEEGLNGVSYIYVLVAIKTHPHAIRIRDHR